MPSDICGKYCFMFVHALYYLIHVVLATDTPAHRPNVPSTSRKINRRRLSLKGHFSDFAARRMSTCTVRILTLCALPYCRRELRSVQYSLAARRVNSPFPLKREVDCTDTILIFSPCYQVVYYLDELHVYMSTIELPDISLLVKTLFLFALRYNFMTNTLTPTMEATTAIRLRRYYTSMPRLCRGESPGEHLQVDNLLF